MNSFIFSIKLRSGEFIGFFIRLKAMLNNGINRYAYALGTTY